MGTSIVIPPYAEPVSLVEMKNHLKVELSVMDDDALITAQIAAARDVIETATGSNIARNNIMVATTFDYTMMSFYPQRAGAVDSWFPRNYLTGGAVDNWYFNIAVPRVPLISVTSITYVDQSGATQTLSASLYSITDAPRGIISLNYNESWPSARWQPNAVTVRFIAGMAAPFTATVATDVITVRGRSLTVDDRVRVMNSGGALPGGLQASTDHFAIAGGKLSLTSGGTAVDITGIGSGTHFIGGDLTGFESLRAAIKLLVGFWYDNRSAVDTGRQAVGATVLPFAVDALVAAQHA